MKLIFTYIKKFGELNDLNFNLGGKYRLFYNSQSKKITFERNDFYLKNIFDVTDERQPNYAFVKHVSAVIGENGTGKSTFLEFIKQNFILGVSAFKTEAIIGLEDYENNDLLLYISTEIKVDKASLEIITIEGFKVKFYGPKRVISDSKLINKQYEITQYGDIPEVSATSYVFLSNIFDKKQEIELSGLYNISTNFLLEEDSRKKIERGLSIANINLVEEHRFNEIEREIDFINAFKRTLAQYISFELPNRINMSLIDEPESKSHDQLFETKPYFFLTALDLFVTESQKNVPNFIKYILKFYKRSIANVFIEFYKYQDSSPYSFDIIINNIDKYLDNDPLITIKNIITYLIDITKSASYIQNKFLAIQETGNLLTEYVKEFDNGVDSELNIFQFHLDTEYHQGKFFNIYNKYKAIFSLEPFLNFNWTDLSTGEKSMLNIYSRLYYLSDKELQRRGANLVLHNNIMLLIDEGESHLHPAWQKEILLQLLNILPVIFKREYEPDFKKPRNIQIILTSNSPLLISDIPSSNLVFLKKEIKNNKKIIIVQDSLNDHKQTFAANIHTLFSDSFFMKNGLIGDFASKIINKVIRDLTKNSDLDLQQREEIRKIIHQIGEPIIKNKLMQMYNERFNLNIHERLDKIELRLNSNNDKN